MTAFKEFTEMLRPFLWLWRSVQVSGVAFLHQKQWILAGLRITLGNKSRGVHIARQIHNCFILDAIFSINDFGQVLYAAMKDGRVSLTTMVDTSVPEMFLSRWHAKCDEKEFPLNWSPPRRYDARAAAHSYHTPLESIAIGTALESLDEILPPAEYPHYEVALRRSDPAFRGLADLARQLLPGMKLESFRSGEVHVLAPIPITIRYEYEGNLMVHAPIGKPLELRCFFDHDVGPLQPLLLTPMNDWCGEGRVTVNWPADSTQATVSLFAADHLITEIDILRWPNAPTLGLRMNTYFDPAHEGLRELLISKNAKSFEEGVVRLLHLFGIPAVWYHSTKGGRRPDAGALCSFDDRHIILLVECTTEKPVEKFSPLRIRAEELRQHMGNTCDVLPIVFAGCAIYDDEINAAVNHKVSLVGEHEIRGFLELLEDNPTSEAVYKAFCHLQQSNPFRDLFRSHVGGR